MQSLTSLIVLFAILLCGTKGSAKGQNVRFNFDKGANFSKFKTYRWVAVKGAPQIDELTDRDIKTAVNAELSKKGMEIDDSDNADLDVGYQTSVDQEKQFNSYTSGWGPGWSWGTGWGWGLGLGWGPGWWGGWDAWTTTTISTIYTGQLNLDFYDSRSHDLVWRGGVSQTIDPDTKPEKQEKKLEKAVAKLLKNFPPKKNGQL
jgi:Domain of unknown function (DUF4136)